MDERWPIAIALIAGGLTAGAVAGWLVRRRLARTDESTGTSLVAGVAGLFIFWFLTFLGLLFAVALVRPDTLEDLPRQMLDYSPRLLVAGFILIAGYAAAAAASSVVAFGLERASGHGVLRVARVIRWSIFAAAIILALAQLGIDTTILILLTGLLGFGIALSGALLVGLGGQHLSREIASGRYLRRFVRPGFGIEAASESGRVVALHPATVELETDAGHRRHVAYSRLLESGFTIQSSEPRDP
jgi:MFS family permease